MSRRKDQERYQRLKEQKPGYVGFRGANTPPPKSSDALETVTCAVCNRKRNVAVDSLPDDRNSFVCLSCQEEQEAAVAAAPE